jgi:molybdate ABC transporter permease protein
VLPSDLSPLWLSLEVAGLATIGTTVLGTLLARLMMGLSSRRRIFMETLILCPMILPPTVVGYVLMMFLGRSGPFQFLSPSGFLFTSTAAIVAAITVSLPLMYLSARAAFRSVDRHLVDAAESFGASRIKSFFTIQIPLAIPGLSAGILLSFGRALGEFGATLMVAGNIPGETQTLPIALYFDVEAGNYSRAWVWTAIAFTTSGFIIALINILSEPKK